MAAAYTWPGSLPQTPLLSNYQESRGVRVKRTAVDKGPPKMRYVGRRSNPFSVGYVMDEDQLDTLETFVFATRGGVARFNYPHPRTGEVIEVNIVPSEDGEQYVLVPLGGGLWRVSINMEELP